jgi:hypothetical protein
MTLGPSNRYVHSAYQVTDLDALAAGGEFLKEAGYRRSWGIGRHIQGSQIFDYWRDDRGFLVEHFTDGDLFDASLDARLGSDDRLWPGPVGSARHRRLPRDQARQAEALDRGAVARRRCSCAPRTTNSTSPACAAC